MWLNSHSHGSRVAWFEKVPLVLLQSIQKNIFQYFRRNWEIEQLFQFNGKFTRKSILYWILASQVFVQTQWIYFQNILELQEHNLKYHAYRLVINYHECLENRFIKLKKINHVYFEHKCKPETTKCISVETSPVTIFHFGWLLIDELSDASQIEWSDDE